MKTLKVLAVAIFTLGTVSAANAQVQVSLNANFGGPRYLPVYTPAPVVVEQPVYYEAPVVYARPRTVVVNRHYYARPRTVVVNRPVYYRESYRPVKYHKHKKHYKHAKHVRYVRY